VSTPALATHAVVWIDHRQAIILQLDAGCARRRQVGAQADAVGCDVLEHPTGQQLALGRRFFEL